MEPSLPMSRSSFLSSVTKPVAILLITGLALIGCVSKGKYDTLLQQNEQLQKQSRSMEGNVKLSQNQAADSAKESAILKEELAVTEARTEAAKNVYNKLVTELAGELQNQQITIKQMKSGVNVNLPNDILFSSGSAEVSETGMAVLTKVGKQLIDVPYQTIVIGFTDNAPISENLAKTFPTNWDLAASRATHVVRILETSGIVSDRLAAVSFGENEPVASNDTPEGRKQNRRIEIRLRPVIK